MKTNKKFSLLLCLLLSIQNYVNAQPEIFSKVLQAEGISATKAVATPDGGYILVGNYGIEGLIIKLDSLCNILWSKTISNDSPSGFLPDVVLLNVASTNDSSIVVVGLATDEVTERSKVLCATINLNGEIQWIKKYSVDEGLFGAKALSVQQTTDSGYVMTGYLSKGDNPTSKIIVSKLDKQGNIEWFNYYSGANYHNYGHSVKQAIDGGFIVIGHIDDYPPHNGHTFLMKLSSEGSIEWSKKYHHLTNSWDSGNDVVIKNDGYLCFLDVVTMKTNLVGDVIWSKSNGCPEINYINRPRPKLRKTNDGGYLYLTENEFFYDSKLIKIDSVGNILWSKNIAISATDAIPLKSNRILLVGNGPETKNFQNQIGLYLLDSLGNGQQCINNLNDISEVDSIIYSDLEMDISSGATEITMPVSINSIDVESIEGCIVFDSIAGDHSIKTNILFRVFPNPTSGELHINFNKPIDNNIRFEIYDIRGRLLLSKDLSKEEYQTKINCENLSSGIYYYRIRNFDTYHLTDKLIIVK